MVWLLMSTHQTSDSYSDGLRFEFFRLIWSRSGCHPAACAARTWWQHRREGLLSSKHDRRWQSLPALMNSLLPTCCLTANIHLQVRSLQLKVIQTSRVCLCILIFQASCLFFHYLDSLSSFSISCLWWMLTWICIYQKSSGFWLVLSYFMKYFLFKYSNTWFRWLIPAVTA